VLGIVVEESAAARSGFDHLRHRIDPGQEQRIATRIVAKVATP